MITNRDALDWLDSHVIGNLEVKILLTDALLKADKYRWHDLRKNPTDLPTTWDDNRFYDCVLENHLYDGFYAHFEYVDDYGFGEHRSIFDPDTLGFVDVVFATMEDLGYEKVIAWREIEPFEVGE